ncbi:MAG: hypothetical protein WCF15_05720 [Pseudolabrys sp.]
MRIATAAAPFSHAFAVDDAEALAIAQKHCVMCHAAKPTHESRKRQKTSLWKPSPISESTP